MICGQNIELQRNFNEACYTWLAIHFNNAAFTCSPSSLFVTDVLICIAGISLLPTKPLSFPVAPPFIVGMIISSWSFWQIERCLAPLWWAFAFLRPAAFRKSRYISLKSVGAGTSFFEGDKCFRTVCPMISAVVSIGKMVIEGVAML